MKFNDFDYIISMLYKNAKLHQHQSIASRIDYFSGQFLGTPYCDGAQGEGDLGQFDQSPLYRFDCFDCVTYVNNVLALAYSSDAATFKNTLLRLNYYHANPVYENRFHFMSVDWNPQNQKNHFLKDITLEIKNASGHSVAQKATGEIDKPEWFRRKTRDAIKLKKSVNNVDLNVLLKKLQNLSVLFQKEIANIYYLPLTELFDSSGSANLFVFSQFPKVSIIEIVRPNWNLKDKIGTNLQVSHIGFVIRDEKQELRFRHASSEQGLVVDISFVDYLKNCIKNPTIHGVNVQVPIALPSHPDFLYP